MITYNKKPVALGIFAPNLVWGPYRIRPLISSENTPVFVQNVTINVYG